MNAVLSVVRKKSKQEKFPPRSNTARNTTDCSCGGALRLLQDGSQVQGIIFQTNEGYKFVLKKGSFEQTQQSAEQLRKMQAFFEEVGAPMKRIQEICGTKEEVMQYIRKLNAPFRSPTSV